MKVSRATFLEICGLGVLGATLDARSLVVPSVRLPKPAETKTETGGAGNGGRFRIEDASALVFRPHLDTSFVVRSADRVGARLVLTEVAERPVTRNVEQFSLIFHAPAGAPLRDGTHNFVHPAFGEFPLFIVSVGASNLRRTAYQACFSRHLRT